MSFAFVFFGLMLTTAHCYDGEKRKEGIYTVVKGTILKNHVISQHNARDSIECGMSCASVYNCQSFNYKHGSTCQLNSKNRLMANGGDNPCDPDHCMYESQCNPVSNADIYQCNCRPGYTGRHCEKEPPLSCKDALDKGKSHGNGEYYIDPERTGTAFPVYCDMTNEGGGWMMVLNLTYDASRAAFTPDSSFRSLSKFKEGYMGLTSNAMGQLQSFTSFTQMRFYCHKQGVGRTLHIITTPDSKGKAVVDYFSAKTDALAFACDSFTEGTGNNAMLTGRCQKWGRDKSGAQYVGVWGHGFKLDETWRMYDHPMYEAHMYHVILRNGYHNCDDTGSTETNGDSWETYVR